MSCVRRCFVGCAVVVLSVVIVGSGVADAGLGAGAAPSFPAVVTVGDVGVSASIQVRNNNTPPNAASTVCNFGDALPCPAGDPGITLTPSCGLLGGFSSCVSAGADPGVFQLSATGVGQAGTACAGTIFAITMFDPVFGQVRFTPQPAGAAHVVLPTNGSLCQINFTFDVLKSPTIDLNPGLPGMQTVQVVDNTQHDGGVITASGRGTTSGTTVLRRTPTIATTTTPSTTIGGQLVDSTVVSGLVNPQPGATVVSRLYGPDDALCSGVPVFESVVPYPVAGGAVTSAPFTPVTAGVYRWVTTYSGDVNNAPAFGACNAANETVTVLQATPTIATTTPTSVILGDQLVDSTVVSGLVNPQPGATVVSRLYGPDDALCSGVPVFESVVPYPVAGGVVTSVPVTPAVAGVYRWVTTYSGDVNNAAVSGACNDANESVTVSPVPTPPAAPTAVPVSASQAPVAPAAVPRSLPATGSASGMLVALAVGLTIAGWVLVGASFTRRRRSGSTA
jgi:hypothetical protein